MQENHDIVSLISSSDTSLSARRLPSYLSEDVEYLMMANHPDAPICRALHGKATVSEYLSIIPLMYKVASRTIKRIIQNGPHTVVIGHDLAVIYPDNQKYSSDWTAILAIQSGKITRIQYIFQNMLNIV